MVMRGVCQVLCKDSPARDKKFERSSAMETQCVYDSVSTVLTTVG